MLFRSDVRGDDFPKFVAVSQRLSRLELYIDDTPGLSVPALRTRARRLKRTRGLEMIVIDYLQLMTAGPGVTPENRVQEISAITRGLKSLAKELNVPVLALSQLSRAVESRTDKRPMLSDLRESGSIEQDADVVLFIYRDDYYNKETSEKPGQAELIVAKHRNGAVGSVDLAFMAHYTSFADLARGEV